MSPVSTYFLSYDRDIPERMTRKQLKKYVETGDISFDDYPWDMNFYCCQIFYLNRFYFIPYMWGDAPTAWRNRETGKVTALWRAGDRVRRDGQIDGVNGITDPEAFTTALEENEDTVCGNRVLPSRRILSPARHRAVTFPVSRFRHAVGASPHI